MSFTKKQCEDVRDVYHKTLDRSNLTLEEIECASKFTLGDLIVQAGFTLVEASQFVKFLQLEVKRHMAVGFNVNKKQVKESREIIVECDSMCKLAGLIGDVMGAGEETDDYHPKDNSQGGVRFEDHGAGEQAGMIKSNLQSIASKAQSLHDTIGDMDQLPEWVQEKIAVADEMIDTISDYLKYEYGKMK